MLIPRRRRWGAATDWSRVLCGDDFTTALRPGRRAVGLRRQHLGRPEPGRRSPTGSSTPYAALHHQRRHAARGRHTDLVHAPRRVGLVLRSPTVGFSWSAVGRLGDRRLQVVLDRPGRGDRGVDRLSEHGHDEGLRRRGRRPPLLPRQGRGPRRQLGSHEHRAMRIDTTPPIRHAGAAGRRRVLRAGQHGPVLERGRGRPLGRRRRLHGARRVADRRGRRARHHAVGSHDFSVTATDGAGNEEVVALTYSVAAPLTFTITPTAGPNGSHQPGHAADRRLRRPARPSRSRRPPATTSPTCSSTAPRSGAVTSYTFTNVTADHTISATFAIDTFTITPTAGPNGPSARPTPQTVDSGGSQAFTITPAAGYHVADVLVDGASVGAGHELHVHQRHRRPHDQRHASRSTPSRSRPRPGPTAPSARPRRRPSTTAATRCSPSRPTPATTSPTCSSTACRSAPVTSYTFTNVTADHTISATFAIDTFTITPSAGAARRHQPLDAADGRRTAATRPSRSRGRRATTSPTSSSTASPSAR